MSMLGKKGLPVLRHWGLWMSIGVLGSAVGLALAAVPVAAQQPAFERDADSVIDPDTGVRLPPGFRATVFADGLGRARHLVVRDNGDVYVRLREAREGGGIVALRDTNADGRADEVQHFGGSGAGDESVGAGTGIDIHAGHLYVSSNDAIYRYSLADNVLVPEGEPKIIAEGFPQQRQHASKAFAFDDEGRLYVNVGAPSNACMRQTRTAGSPGQQPCKQLERQAGIWRFDAERVGQSQRGSGKRFVTGVRNVVALDWNPGSRELFFVQHGRDQLQEFFPTLYSAEQNAELPAEELHVAREGADYGWPYTYYDPIAKSRMVAPEYGGDGKTPAKAGKYEEPILAFPGHWGPNDLLFYTGDQFPAAFQGGAFIAFHGSWNRSPLPQAGFNVVFVPFEGNRPRGDWYVFADGFAGAEPPADPREAPRRPMGLAVGPDGGLFVSDSIQGRIWRIGHDGG